MSTKEPLDYGLTSSKKMSTAALIQLLQKNGYPNVYEKKNGEWRPTVAVEWLGSYVVTPAILLFILTKILSLNGTGPLIASILIGWVIGNVWANQKRKETDELLMELLE